LIKAMIFDFDGTIIDTETAWFVAFREAYGQRGVELTLEQYSQCIGTNLKTFNPYEYLITERKMPMDRDLFREEVQARHADLMKKERIRPGILDFLSEAKAAGLRIGLASSSSRAWVDKYLLQLDIRNYFECIRTADDVKNVKPDPELYLQALSCLGVKGEEAVAIEDSPNGAKAAAAAGMHCVVVPNSITRHLAFDPGHYSADSLTSLNFDDVIANPIGK